MQKQDDGSAQQSAQAIREIFESIAPVYDDFNQQLSLGLHRIWKQMAVQWCQVESGNSCLDVCCGSGDIALLLSKQVGSAGTVFGLDFSPAQLDVARQKARRSASDASLHWVQGDALDLPFSEATFDAATMGYGLRNLTDIPKGLAELNRVLKPGGRAAILDFNQPEIPLVQAFQRWYLDTIVVPMAKGHQLTEAYAYIGPSLDRFPSGRQQVQLGLAAGFSEVIHYPIAGGLMGVLVLER